MNIVVCVKQVVDTEAVIALDGAGEVELMGQTMVIDPYSEFAVERAVQLKEELGGTVTLLTLGSQDCLAAVRHGLAMGADAAVLIEDEQWTARDAAQAAAHFLLQGIARPTSTPSAHTQTFSSAISRQSQAFK